MTEPRPDSTDAQAQRPPAELNEERIATAAARQAMSVSGVLRLQPGLKHAVGAAARALFTSGREDDQLAAAASGIEVSQWVSDGTADTTGGVEVVLRVVTAAQPSPRSIAQDVQQVVTEELATFTGRAVRVVVVIVDVEDDDAKAEM